MKIKGPGGPKAPSAPEGTDDVKGLKKKDKAGVFADKLNATNKMTGPTTPTPSDPVKALAAQVDAGKITARQAVDKLTQLALDAGGGRHLPDKVKAKIRSELETLLKEDPYLGARGQRLGLKDD